MHRLPAYVRAFIAVFLLALTLGYINGLFLMKDTSGFTPNTIERNYLGNEEDEEAETMFFQKPEREILTVVHDHMLSLSILFLVLGALLSITSLSKPLKKFFMIEPLLSVIITFEGIYFMWKGFVWLKYVILISGTMMTFSFFASVILLLVQLKKKAEK